MVIVCEIDFKKSPHRPGDKAQLMSEEFPATDKTAQGPLCLRFWTHMFGNGVGRLFRFVIKNHLKSNRSCLV